MKKALSPKWIFPPGLDRIKTKFLSLYNSAYKRTDRRKPLIISGARGIGKSAFADEFEKLYLMDNPGKKVVPVNIATIPETLIEDALFGHKRGAYTGAIKDEPGFVENADLLKLEEIGELPRHVQAKLLTFLEDGIYYRLGDKTKLIAKNIQIVCTTNKSEDDFRPDFYDRFLHFSIPTIHERREDILYYLAWYCPEIIHILKPCEFLILMAYNWPGNVREIERFAEEVKSLFDYQGESKSLGNKKLKDLGWRILPISRMLMDYGSDFTERLNLRRIFGTNNSWSDTLYSQLCRQAGSRQAKRQLTDFLKEFARKSLLITPRDQPSAGWHKPSLIHSLPKAPRIPGDLKAIISEGQRVKFFDDLHAGLGVFCQYTSQDIKANRNLLDLSRDIEGEKETFDLAAWTKDQLLKEFYRAHLEKAGGNKTEAAEKAGIPYQTFLRLTKGM